MKITELHLENFKKLKAINLDLEGKSLTLTGPNGSGKSSVIDSIWIALTGKEVPDNPITQGEDNGTITVKIKEDSGNELTVQKKFTLDTRTLTVRNSDGTKEPSAQAFLDRIIGRISFDPFGFIRKQPREQKKFLMDLLGLDFSELDKQKALYNENKFTSEKEVIQYQNTLTDLPNVDKGFETERSVNEALEKQKAISDVKARATKIEQEISMAQSSIVTFNTNIGATKKRIEELQATIVSSEAEIAKTQTMIAGHEEILVKEKAYLATNPLEDVDALVNEIQVHNNNHRVFLQRQATRQQLIKAQEEVKKWTEEAKRVEEARLATIKETKMPVKGLTFAEDGLLYEGLPVNEQQLSHAKLIDIGVRISMALNPGLRIMRIKDGSLIDTSTLTAIKAAVKEQDYQLFIEKVANTGEIGFEIEEL